MLDAPRSRQSALSVFKLSKFKYYLVDNICYLILSELIGGVQEESEGTGERVPRGNLRTDGCCIVGAKNGDSPVECTPQGTRRIAITFY
jgi:hypothetical protein